MISMKEIAREAGVSRTTVSFVLNNRDAEMKISAAVSARVRQIATRRGYVKNELVRSVVKGTSRTIAMIIVPKDYMFPAVCGFIDEAHQHGYMVNMIPAHYDLNESFERALSLRPAGIYLMAVGVAKDYVNPRYLQHGVPVLGMTPGNERMNFDQKRSSAAGTEYLISLGHRNIVYIAGNSDIARDREAGYTGVMEKHDLTGRIIRTQPDYTKYMAEYLDEIIESKATAVQCFNDYCALELMQECYRRRMFIPDAFSLLGFGNVPASKCSSPALSSVCEPYYDTGKIMFLRMQNMIKKGRETEDYGLLYGEVIPRESTVPYFDV